MRLVQVAEIGGGGGGGGLQSQLWSYFLMHPYLLIYSVSLKHTGSNVVSNIAM